MGLKLEVRADGERAPALERAWQALSVQLGVGYEFDTARLTLGAPNGVVELPRRARLQFHVRRPAGGAEAVGHLFHSTGVRGSSRDGTVVISASAVDPDGALNRPRTATWDGGPLSAVAEAVAERAGLAAVIDPALGRRVLAPRPQIGVSDQTFLGGLVNRLGGRLVIQEDHLIVADAADPQTASGVILPPVTVDLAASGAWIDWSRQDTDVVGRAEATYVGSDGVTVWAIGAGEGDAADRLPGTFDTPEMAAAASGRVVQDALAGQESLDITTGLRLDAIPLAQLVVRGALPTGFSGDLSIEAVRHEIGRRAATTTITARPVRAGVAIDPIPEDEPAGVGPGETTAADGRRAPVRLDVVRRVAGGHPEAIRNAHTNWEFLDATIETLRRQDTPEHRLRWGYNCKRGDCSHLSRDAIAYYLGEASDPNGSTDVEIIDIISASTSPADAAPAWTDVTADTLRRGAVGRWKYPRRT